MSAERTLLKRLVEECDNATPFPMRGKTIHAIAMAARALLAEPEGEKSSGCPRRQSPQTPCVLEVGPMDADEEGICVGCGMPWEGAVRQQERPTPRSRAEAEAMVAIIRDMMEGEEPCYYDHHGYCQAHGWLDASPCPFKRAAALLAALTGEDK